MKFDGWNRLTEIKDGSTVIGRYEYDALNRRVKRHVDSDALSSLSGIDAYMHYFFSKNWQVLGRRDTTTENDQPENLQPKYQYLWSPRYIDAPVLRDENTDDDGMCDDGRIYYLGDANFNLTTLVDTAGDAAERYYYESYGGVTIRDGSWTTSLSGSGHDNQIMFSGRERDGESRLYHIRARMYQTGTGRWLSVDPLSFAGGINRFCYVDNNPVMFIDPSGRVTFWNDYSRGNDDLVEPNYQTAQIRVTLMVGVSACKHFENDPGGLLGPFLATPCCVGRVSAKLCYKAVAVSSPRAALFLDPIFAHGELFLKYKGRRVPCDYSSVGDDVAGSYYSCCVPLGEYTCVGDRANGTATIFSTARWHWNDWLPRRLSGHTYQTIDFSFAISACGNVRNPQLRLNQPGRPGYRQSDLLRLTGSNFILGPHIEPHPTG